LSFATKENKPSTLFINNSFLQTFSFHFLLFVCSFFCQVYFLFLTCKNYFILSFSQMQELLYLNSFLYYLYIIYIGQFFGCFLFIIKISCCMLFPLENGSCKNNFETYLKRKISQGNFHLKKERTNEENLWIFQKVWW